MENGYHGLGWTPLVTSSSGRQSYKNGWISHYLPPPPPPTLSQHDVVSTARLMKCAHRSNVFFTWNNTTVWKLIGNYIQPYGQPTEGATRCNYRSRRRWLPNPCLYCSIVLNMSHCLQCHIIRPWNSWRSEQIYRVRPRDANWDLTDKSHPPKCKFNAKRKAVTAPVGIT